MKIYSLIFLFSVIFIDTSGQDILELQYCTLFESSIEKNAFEKLSQGKYDAMFFFISYQDNIDSATCFQYQQDFNDYLDKVYNKKIRYRSKKEFLKWLFYKTHRKFLKNYSYMASFTELFKDGSYNCVSGTAFYALILDYLNIDFKIKETFYHVYLEVDLSETNRIIFESTNSLYGFVEHPKSIEKLESRFQQNYSENNFNLNLITGNSTEDTFLRKINLKQLSGLHYYNLAVSFYNQSDYLSALKVLKKGQMLYPESVRIRNFSGHVLHLYLINMNR